jgi:hypothetical protein
MNATAGDLVINIEADEQSLQTAAEAHKAKMARFASIPSTPRQAIRVAALLAICSPAARLGKTTVLAAAAREKRHHAQALHGAPVPMAHRRIDRNAPCPCGCGKKAKRCPKRSA